MQGDIKKLRFYTKIGIYKIIVEFSTFLDYKMIPKPEDIQKMVVKEYKHELSEWENVDNIKKILRSHYCYRVVIIPQLKGLVYGYEIEI